MVSSLFAVDVDGVDAPMHPDIPFPPYREPSPTPSSSSEEVIMFRGRGGSSPMSRSFPAITKTHPRVVEDGVRVADDSNRFMNDQVMVEKHVEAVVGDGQNVVKATVDEKVTVNVKKGHRNNGKALLREMSTDSDEEYLADYIDNLKNNNEDGFGDALLLGSSSSQAAEKDEKDDKDDKDDELWEGVDEVEEEKLAEEEKYLERKMNRMTQERLEKILKQHEKHGISSDELLLRDEEDDESDDESSEADDEVENVPGTPLNNDDVLDGSSPNEETTTNQGRLPLPFDLSDSDLAANMEETWAKDRTKKAMKKQRRQELHEQGLIGKKWKNAERRKTIGAPMDVNLLSIKYSLLMMAKNKTEEYEPTEDCLRKDPLADDEQTEPSRIGHRPASHRARNGQRVRLHVEIERTPSEPHHEDLPDRGIDEDGCGRC